MKRHSHFLMISTSHNQDGCRDRRKSKMRWVRAIHKLLRRIAKQNSSLMMAVIMHVLHRSFNSGACLPVSHERPQNADVGRANCGGWARIILANLCHCCPTRYVSESDQKQNACIVQSYRFTSCLPFRQLVSSSPNHVATIQPNQIGNIAI